jgi:hypothetical protein
LGTGGAAGRCPRGWSGGGEAAHSGGLLVFQVVGVCGRCGWAGGPEVCAGSASERAARLGPVSVFEVEGQQGEEKRQNGTGGRQGHLL